MAAPWQKKAEAFCQAAKPTVGAFLARPCSDSSPADVNRGMAGPTEAAAAHRAGLRPTPKEKIPCRGLGMPKKKAS